MALGSVTWPESVHTPVVPAACAMANTPLPVGTSMKVACPSSVDGTATALVAFWPPMPSYVTPAGVSTKGASVLPRPPNSGWPLVSLLLA